MRRTQTYLAWILSFVLLGALSGSVMAQSEDADLVPALESGLRYGDDSPKQVIHALTLEPRDLPRPAVVFFHGGGLIMGEPMQDYGWAEAVAKEGYVAFLAGYRLIENWSETGQWPAQLEDAQAVVRWVREHADEFNVDPDRVCAIGHSSGGHLAGLTGTTDAVVDGISSRVDCVVDISGDGDLTVPYSNPMWTNTFVDMFGGTLEEVPDAWKAASPTHNVDEETVPFLIIHGTRDREVPIQMSRNLADALAEAEREFVYAELPAGHMNIGDPELTAALQIAFLEAHLHPEE